MMEVVVVVAQVVRSIRVRALLSVLSLLPFFGGDLRVAAGRRRRKGNRERGGSRR